MVSTRRSRAVAAAAADVKPTEMSVVPPILSSTTALEAALKKLRRQPNIGYLFAARLSEGTPVAAALFDAMTERIALQPTHN